MAVAVESGQGSPLHRNMSAPPRMTLSIRTLARAGSEDDAASAGQAPPGFRRLLLLDIAALAEHHLGALEAPEQRAAVFPPLSMSCVMEDLDDDARFRQLGYLVLLARLAREPNLVFTRFDLRRLARRSGDSLCDEFVELANGLEPRALGLPAFALTAYWRPEPGCELDPARAVAVLSRFDAAGFIAARSPLVPYLDSSRGCTFAVLVPEAGR